MKTDRRAPSNPMSASTHLARCSPNHPSGKRSILTARDLSLESKSGGLREGGVGRGVGVVLSAGQPAHFTVLGPGLVHERAVHARPHGGGGRRCRRVAHAVETHRRRRLPPYRACGRERRQTSLLHTHSFGD